MSTHTRDGAELLPALQAQAILAQKGWRKLERGVIHVWSFELEAPPESVAACLEWLSDEERDRAFRFRFPHLQTQYIVAHGVLRKLLSSFCGVSPAELRFVTATPAGKPCLAPGSLGADTLTFNLSHSSARALVGIGLDIPMGVDLECMRTEVDALSISRHYFFGAERDAIEAAAAELREHTFFRYWVAKEAVLKAQGVGLGFPLDRFRVDFLPDAQTARIDSLDPERLASDWTVRMLPCEAGWLAAVAARGSAWRVKIERLL